MCIIVAWLHFTWLYRVTRRSNCTAVVLGRGLTPPPLFSAWPTCWSRRHPEHDYSTRSRLCSLIGASGRIVFCARSTICRNVRRVWSLGEDGGGQTPASLALAADSSLLFTVQGHLVESCLDHSAVPQVCEETLGKVRADCLKDGTNVT